MTVSTVPSADGSGRRDAVTYSWWGQAHPVQILRRLRNLMLGAIAAMALVGGVAAAEAVSAIGTINATRESIGHINSAEVAADKALVGLKGTFDHRDVTLTGTGTEFVTQIGSANSHISFAAPGISSRDNGTMRFQFVLGQLATSVHLAETAVQQYEDFTLGGGYQRQADQAAQAALWAPNEPRGPGPDDTFPSTGGLIQALEDLLAHQREALPHQQPLLLAPLVLWPLLLVPALGVLVCAAMTAHVLARHFRRLVSPLLGTALLITVAVTVTGGALGQQQYDLMSMTPEKGRIPEKSETLANLSAFPLVVTSAGMLALLAAAMVFAHLAYRPRLAEYRFGPS